MNRASGSCTRVWLPRLSYLIYHQYSLMSACGAHRRVRRDSGPGTVGLRRRHGVAALRRLRRVVGCAGLLHRVACGRRAVGRRVDQVLRDHALEPRRQLRVQLHHLRVVLVVFIRDVASDKSQGI